MNRTILCFLLFVVYGCESSNTLDDFESAIDSFALGTPVDETTAAIDSINAAGIDAFGSLLARIDDRARASDDHFMGAQVTIDAEGNIGPYEPTIGDACFDLLQGQIEGYWAKACRHYQVLEHQNIKEWLVTRKGKTLNELRLECAHESLRLAQRDNENSPSELTKHCVASLTRNLNEARSRFENSR